MDRRCEKLQLHRLHHTGSNNTAKYSRNFGNAIDVGLQKPGRYTVEENDSRTERHYICHKFWKAKSLLIGNVSPLHVLPSF